MTKALDINTFHISNKSLSDASILDKAVIADQTGDGGPTTLTRQLMSSSRTRTVAVVDRTADVEAAARAITRARFGFGGRSPYAPDLVLVNEFVKKAFLEACSRYVTGAFAGEVKKRKVDASAAEDAVKRVVKEAENRKEVVSFGSDEFKVVEILDKYALLSPRRTRCGMNSNAYLLGRSSPIMKMKIKGRYLPVVLCSSLVDAVFSQEFEYVKPYTPFYILLGLAGLTSARQKPAPGRLFLRGPSSRQIPLAVSPLPHLLRQPHPRSPACRPGCTHCPCSGVPVPLQP